MKKNASSGVDIPLTKRAKPKSVDGLANEGTITSYEEEL
jgi:hypothetical protein